MVRKVAMERAVVQLSRTVCSSRNGMQLVQCVGADCCGLSAELATRSYALRARLLLIQQVGRRRGAGLRPGAAARTSVDTS